MNNKLMLLLAVGVLLLSGCCLSPDLPLIPCL